MQAFAFRSSSSPTKPPSKHRPNSEPTSSSFTPAPIASACWRGTRQPFAAEIARLQVSAGQAHRAGLEVHAGHGLTFDTVATLARMQEIVELNIGHFIMGEAMFVGLPAAVREMRRRMDAARP